MPSKLRTTVGPAGPLCLLSPKYVRFLSRFESFCTLVNGCTHLICRTVWRMKILHVALKIWPRNYDKTSYVNCFLMKFYRKLQLWGLKVRDFFSQSGSDFHAEGMSVSWIYQIRVLNRDETSQIISPGPYVPNSAEHCIQSGSIKVKLANVQNVLIWSQQYVLLFQGEDRPSYTHNRVRRVQIWNRSITARFADTAARSQVNTYNRICHDRYRSIDDGSVKSKC